MSDTPTMPAMTAPLSAVATAAAAYNVLWQFGNYLYTARNTVLSFAKEVEAKSRFAETPGRHGQYSQGGLYAPRKVTISAHLIPQPGDDFETLRDALCSAHAPGGYQILYTGRDDRYLKAEVVGFKETSPDVYPTSLRWEAQFVASDPFTYSALTYTGTLSGGADDEMVAGSAPTLPLITLSPTTNTAGTIMVTNQTTGKFFTVATPIPFTSGTLPVAKVDCFTGTVTDANGVDLTYLFAGQFFELVPGLNHITVSQVAGGSQTTVVNAGLAYRARWW